MVVRLRVMLMRAVTVAEWEFVSVGVYVGGCRRCGRLLRRR